MNRYFNFSFAFADLPDLMSGLVKSETITVQWNEFEGVYLDYALANLHEDLVFVTFVFTPGFRPERVDAGMSADAITRWCPTQSRDQAAILVRRYLGRDLLQDEPLLPALQQVLRMQMGDEIDLRIFAREKN